MNIYIYIYTWYRERDMFSSLSPCILDATPGCFEEALAGRACGHSRNEGSYPDACVHTGVCVQQKRSSG